MGLINCSVFDRLWEYLVPITWCQVPGTNYPDCCLSQDVRKSVFGRLPWKFKFYTINEAHKQSSLLDKLFNYIFYFGPPGKHLYLSPQNPLHVGRRSRPTYNRFSCFFYRCFPGGPFLQQVKHTIQRWILSRRRLGGSWGHEFSMQGRVLHGSKMKNCLAWDGRYTTRRP